MRAEVMAAQSMINLITGGLKVDGIWGPRTERAYMVAEDVSSNAISSFFRAVNKPLPRPKAALVSVREDELGWFPPTTREYAVRNNTFIEADMSVRAAIEKAATTFGIPVPQMMAKAHIESAMNPEAINGEYRGLFQNSAEVWDEVRPLLSQKGVIIDSYQDAWNDPWQSAMVAAAYVKLNERYARAAGYDGPWDSTAIYLSHQQGAAGFTEVWRAAKVGGSVTSIDARRRMLANTPPDTGGATVNGNEFISRWRNVIRAREGLYA